MAAEADAVRQLASQVATALAAADLSAHSELLDPHVTWGPPGARTGTCQSREEVLSWYRRGREAGARATVTETSVAGDKILVGLLVTGRPEPGMDPDEAQPRWQVLTVRDGRVAGIVGFDDRDEAVAWSGFGQD
jgi:SnoaL-like domain